MRVSLTCRLLFSLLLLFIFSGCATIGPATVERDRFDYSTSIAESWKQMMLLNIVKLRYGDTPIFLEVGSIVNQYTFETQLEASADLSSGDFFGNGMTLGGKGKFADRPTITYTPMMGKKFAKSLLTPIPPHVLFSLIQSGWNAEFILRVCLSAVNDLYNSSGRQMMNRSADKEFLEVLDTLAYIQQSGGLGSRLMDKENGKVIVFFRRNSEKEFEQQVLLFLELLGLNPDSDEFSLIYGSSAANDKEIAMLTRSMLEIIAEISQYVRVPENHIKENRASSGNYTSSTTIDEKRSRVFIKSSEEKPGDAFLAIEYRDHWFYIEDTDYRSKRLFSFLLFLFSLAERGSQALSPVLTLPAG